MSVLEGTRGHKRRTSNLKGEKRRSVIISLLIRDGLNCSRCHEPFTQSNRPSLDHLMPRLIGGGDDQENLTLSHERCNALASNPPLGRRRTKEDGVIEHAFVIEASGSYEAAAEQIGFPNTQAVKP